MKPDAETVFRVEIGNAPAEYPGARCALGRYRAALRQFGDCLVQVVDAEREQEKSFAVGI